MTAAAAPLVRDEGDADALGFAAAREICRRHARSFYFASFFLPKPKREAAYAVYALCRTIDDAIDADDDAIETAQARALREYPVVARATSRAAEAASPSLDSVGSSSSCCSDGTLETRLRLFHDRLDEIYENRLELPRPAARSEPQHALHAFSLTVHRYQIPKQYFLDLAEGCRMDLVVSRYPTWRSLENYCYHVAGVVGLIMTCVLGLTHSDARQQAVQMGNAMRLTNILRDVKEHFRGGRIYLPLEDMAGFRYSERDLAAGAVNENFRGLMRFEVARARQLYRDASDGLCWLAGDSSRFTVAAMAVMSAGVLDAIEWQDYDVLHGGRPHLPTVEKLRRLPAAWRLARRQPGEAVPDVFGGRRG
jgi:15-cis-phytoene synthase